MNGLSKLAALLAQNPYGTGMGPGQVGPPGAFDETGLPYPEVLLDMDNEPAGQMDNWQPNPYPANTGQVGGPGSEFERPGYMKKLLGDGQHQKWREYVKEMEARGVPMSETPPRPDGAPNQMDQPSEPGLMDRIRQSIGGAADYMGEKAGNAADYMGEQAGNAADYMGEQAGTVERLARLLMNMQKNPYEQGAGQVGGPYQSPQGYGAGMVGTHRDPTQVYLEPPWKPQPYYPYLGPVESRKR